MWLDHVVAQRAALALTIDIIDYVVYNISALTVRTILLYWNVNYFCVIRAIAMESVIGNALYRLHASRLQSMAVATSSR